MPQRGLGIQPPVNVARAPSPAKTQRSDSKSRRNISITSSGVTATMNPENSITANAAKLRDLKEAVKSTFRVRHEGAHLKWRPGARRVVSSTCPTTNSLFRVALANPCGDLSRKIQSRLNLQFSFLRQTPCSFARDKGRVPGTSQPGNSAE
jgi:hypothetical protein